VIHDGAAEPCAGDADASTQVVMTVERVCRFFTDPQMVAQGQAG
jgi:hypothetical protein